MNAETIYAKYWTALVEVEAVMIPADTAVALALNLAVSEAYDAGAALCNDMAAIIASQTQQTPDQRQAEADRAQMALIAEWLAENAPALYYSEHGGYGDAIIEAVRRRDDQIAELQGEIAKVDADNADLLRTLKAAHDGWTKAQADADRLALRIAQQPAEIHANGNGAPLAAPTPTDATWWANLDDETNDWRISLEAGRRTFRQVPKASRLLLAQAVARSIGGGALPMQHEFDAGKPDWMPGGGGLARSFGIVWSELLTVTTFEVAP